MLPALVLLYPLPLVLTCMSSWLWRTLHISTKQMPMMHQGCVLPPAPYAHVRVQLVTEDFARQLKADACASSLAELPDGTQRTGRYLDIKAQPTQPRLKVCMASRFAPF